MERVEDLFEQDNETTSEEKNKQLSDILLTVWSKEHLSEIWRIEATEQTASGWAAMKKKDSPSR